MKYKAFITREENIYWTKNSVDKPSKMGFDELMENIIWLEMGEITPNFINQFNGSIVVDSDDYTYLKLENTETNEVKYFTIDRVSKVLNNGYVIDITLDVFTTYTLNLYEYIEDKQIYVNRTSALCVYGNDIQANLKQDPLLDIQYNPGIYHTTNTRTWMIFNYKDLSTSASCILATANSNTEWRINKYLGTNSSIDSIVKTDGPYSELGKIYSLTLFDIFQDLDGSFYLVPIFGERDASLTLYKGNWLEVNFKYYDGGNITAKCWNYLGHTDNIKNNTYWANKYVGRFHIPLWYEMLLKVGVPVLVSTTFNNPHLGQKGYLLMFKISGALNLDITQNATFDILQQFDFSKITSKVINRRGKLPNIYLCAKLTQEGHNQPIFNFYADFTKNPATIETSKVNVWVQYPYTTDLNYSVLISPTEGVMWLNTKLPYVNMLKGNETFPTTTNAYSQYLAGVQTQQNTNLQVAKQQLIMKGVNSYVGGMLGLASGAIGGNIAGTISSGIGVVSAGINGISNIVNNVLQFQNQKRQTDAMNADKLRSMSANTINPSSIQANIANSKITKIAKYPVGKIKFGDIDGIIANKPFNNLDNELYNTLIWESGFYVGNYVILNELKSMFDISIFSDNVNEFIYWDIEIPEYYVKQKFKNFNNELIDAIITTINNPVRFWRYFPNYESELKLEISHKLSKTTKK